MRSIRNLENIYIWLADASWVFELQHVVEVKNMAEMALFKPQKTLFINKNLVYKVI